MPGRILSLHSEPLHPILLLLLHQGPCTYRQLLAKATKAKIQRLHDAGLRLRQRGTRALLGRQPVFLVIADFYYGFGCICRVQVLWPLRFLN